MARAPVVWICSPRLIELFCYPWLRCVLFSCDCHEVLSLLVSDTHVVRKGAIVPDWEKGTSGLLPHTAWGQGFASVFSIYVTFTTDVHRQFL